MDEIMAALPTPTRYHRWLGWHAPALRQGLVAACIGGVAGLVANRFQPWQVAIVEGWDVAAIVLLGVTWPMILRADAAATRAHSLRPDPGRFAASVLLLNASTASLVGVGILLTMVRTVDSPQRPVLLGVAVATVVLSWTLVNTVYVLRYAHLRFGQGCDGFAFADPTTAQQPCYRDFVYVAFTIGMTYQVSDTAVGDRRTRGAVVGHALLSYLFGVVIVAGSINLIAGLIR